MDEQPAKKLRGPYRVYNVYGIDQPVPRQTSWNQNKRIQQANDADQVDQHYEEAALELERQLQPESEPELDDELDTEGELGSESEIDQEPQLEPQFASEPEGELHSEPELDNELDTEGELESESEIDQEPQLEPQFASEPEGELQSEPELDNGLDTEPERESEQELDSEPEQGPEQDPEQEPEPDPEPDPDDEEDVDEEFPRRDGGGPIYDGSSVTTDQSRVLLLAYIFKHGVSGDGLQDLLKLLDILFPGILPRSKYVFHKEFGQMTNVVYHIICKYCSAYIGCKGQIGVQGHCQQCNRQFVIKENLNDDNFFVTLPLEDQLKDILQNSDIVKDMLIKSHPCEIGINDVCTGEEVRSKMNVGSMTDNDFSLTFNIDGVPVFKSSNRSLWPIQCTINELQADDRKRNVLLTGLWFGRTKPNMTTFLKPLKDEAQRLGTEGFEWRNPISGTTIQSRVFYLCGTCDAVARPVVRNCTQFNGMYGCDWCLHPGEVVPKGDGYMRSFPYVNPEPEPRKRLQHEEDAMKAVEQGRSVHGVKGPSMLMVLPNFDIVTGFVVDYMHCVLLGVARQFVGLWFDSHNHRKPWYVGRKSQDVDRRLVNICPPSEITRVPRSLATRRFWKASEWRSFLLFYSSFVLQDILPAVYLQHWFLLVFATHTLLQNEVTVEDIVQAEMALKKFVVQTAVLYGKEYMTFNVHQLCHWCDSVRMWGPAWAHSSFPFEGNNRCLLKLVHGTQGIVQQLAQNFLLHRSTQKLATSCMADATERCVELFAKLTHVGSYRPIEKRVVNKVQLLGKPKAKQLEIRHQVAVEHLLGEELLSSDTVYFDRFLYKGRIFRSQSYTRSVKRDDSVLQQVDGTFCRLQACVILKVDCHCVGECMCIGIPIAIVKVLRKVQGHMFADQQVGIQSHHINHVVQDRTPLQAIFIDRIQEKCVICKEAADSLYLVALPNRHERD